MYIRYLLFIIYYCDENLFHLVFNIYFVKKPRNLLVNSNWDLKICDFGLARAVDNESTKKSDNLTDYVITR